jgi:hypothetical protein
MLTTPQAEPPIMFTVVTQCMGKHSKSNNNASVELRKKRKTTAQRVLSLCVVDISLVPGTVAWFGPMASSLALMVPYGLVDGHTEKCE